MGFRFQRRFQLFPGVRLNVGKTGASLSFGAPGAWVTVGKTGIRSTVGAPGTGLFYTHHESWNGGAPDQTPPDSVPVFVPASDLKAIESAAIEMLTSPSLEPLRATLAAAESQRQAVMGEIESKGLALTSSRMEKAACESSLFRWFKRKRIATLTAEIPALDSEVTELEQWLEASRVPMDFGLPPEALKAYGGVIRAFDALRACQRVWDVTGERRTDRRRERTGAGRALSKVQVSLEFADGGIVVSQTRIPRLGNANGEELMFFPAFVLMPRADGAFALVDLHDIDLRFEYVQFHEDEEVPSDSQIVSRTWLRVNQDGSRDRRFAENREIPICQYAELRIVSKTGLEEAYMFSNPALALAFAQSLERYGQTLPERET